MLPEFHQNSVPTEQQLYDDSPLISQIIQVRQEIHTRKHCWKSKKKFISDVLWTPTHGHTSVSRPAKEFTFIRFCKDTGSRLEDLIRAITGTDG